MSAQRFRAAFLGLALVVASSAASAQSALDQARVQFNAGAQAYAAGRYGDAQTAFEDAYRLAPKPQILFSLAQAERKRYFAEGRKNPDTLRSAVAHYEEYVKEVKEGARVPDASDALTELGPIVATLAPPAAGTSTTPAPAQSPSTAARLTIYSSAEGAKVSIDGGAPVDAPFIGEIAPGKHSVRVSAEGYADATREVVGEVGTRTSLDVPLEEKPAELVVATDKSCEVYIDGRAVGVAPSARAIPVPAGAHVASFIANGRRIVTKDITLERGKRETVDVAFERSNQRSLSYVSFGLGGAGIALGGTALVVALVEEGKARKIRDASGNILAQDRADYESESRARDTWRTVSIVSFSSGAALLATGALLYAFDKPELTTAAPPKENPPQKKPTNDLAAAPWIGPGAGGVTFVGSF